MVITNTFYVLFGATTLPTMVDTIFLTIPTIIIMCLFIKSPKIEDQFLFHYEIRLTTLASITLAALYVIGVTVLSYLDLFFATAFNNILSQISACIPSLISTYVITLKIMKMDGIREKLKAHQMQESRSNNSIKYIEQQIEREITKIGLHSTKDISKQTNSMSIKTIFSSKQYLDLFAKHLISELSIETLLSYIEFNQYKLLFYQECYSIINDNESREIKSYEINLSNIECIPKSSIIYNTFNKYNNNNMDKLICFKQIALLLNEKYIKSGSKYEINISSSMKRHYINLSNNNYNININDMYTLFDKCTLQMYKFLVASSIRFKKNYSG